MDLLSEQYLFLSMIRWETVNIKWLFPASDTSVVWVYDMKSVMACMLTQVFDGEC